MRTISISASFCGLLNWLFVNAIFSIYMQNCTMSSFMANCASKLLEKFSVLSTII